MGADISMAIQVKSEELNGVKSYFAWILGQIDKDNLTIECSPEMYPVLYSSEISRELCKLMLETDFTWTISEDEIRAKDALELRKKYAEEVGSEAGKSERDIDRIWKSIHGKPSVLEVIFSLCVHLDSMVNEEETGKMIGLFFRILIHNLVLDEFSDGDFDVDDKDYKLDEDTFIYSAAKSPEDARMMISDRRRSEILGIWTGRIKQFLNREYFESGCCGGLFPLKNWQDGTDKNQRKLPLWYQMNAWLDEHLDDDCQFVV